MATVANACVPCLLPTAAGKVLRKIALMLVRLGSVIELVHLATLVHDDILDEADTRHCQETAAGFALPLPLIGDVLFSRT